MKIFFLLVISIYALNADFIRDDRTGIVKDTKLNLEWPDRSIGEAMTFKDAHYYCKDLLFRGSYWRLPSQDELRTIVDKKNFFPAIASAFTQTSNSMYWTSTLYPGNKDGAYTVGFWAGGDHYSLISYKALVRCVRDAK